MLRLDGGLVEMIFDRQDEAINKLDTRTVDELRQAVALLAADSAVRGLLVTSGKRDFIVGADITEFEVKFKLSMDELAADVARSNEVFTALEDLTVPSVAAINGFALGGGLELALAVACRVLSTDAQVGVPEVSLGLFPGFGGTVRLPRVAGAQLGVDWITSGRVASAQTAYEAGVADELVDRAGLRDAALALLRRAAGGELDWRARQQRKRDPLTLHPTYREALFSAAIAKARTTRPKNQPAGMEAAKMMAQAVAMDRSGALAAEARAFAGVAKTQAAASLIQTFLSQQALKRLFRQHAQRARPVQRAAVLGAGIMGGGIAAMSAMSGVPVLLKDIAPAQLDLALAEVKKQSTRLVKNGRQSQQKADAIFGSVRPQLDNDGFDAADFAIEAVVENIGVKHKVLIELEDSVRPDTVIASNTSSLLIEDLAAPLKRPENFVGLHFFNPVPVMPLVEVIRGARTSEEAVATAVSYAVAMGKTPIVVRDCPGFLVNRILTAYIRGFLQLVADGADFARVDQAMEAFGWPMGPAYLEDVVGIDTASHVCDVIAAGYPARMPPLEHDALRLMAAHQRLGQKNGTGFYRYVPDPQGRPRRMPAHDTNTLLAQVQPFGALEFADEEIVDRMMLPLIIEAACALEDQVVATPGELDMALLLGAGFPAYLGGPLKYADWMGLGEVVRRAQRYSQLGAAYWPTQSMRKMAAAGHTYY
jgi:3-hydroxyacyl-CoA dehydrogenase/enoyl-CoA hydratase/3-hydroxybutyryl-CoA epimerase/enoyl-CoA isomerase